MLGEELALQQQQLLLQQLALCKMPFNCAHGRPTVCPIVAVLPIPALQTRLIAEPSDLDEPSADLLAVDDDVTSQLLRLQAQNPQLSACALPAKINSDTILSMKAAIAKETRRNLKRARQHSTSSSLAGAGVQ